MTTYLVTANVNLDASAFRSYEVGDHVATVGYFDVVADSPFEAAEKVFEIGNIGTPDINGNTWREGVRSLSKGDVLYIAGEEPGDVTLLACAPAGWDRIDLPTNACQVPFTTN